MSIFHCTAVLRLKPISVNHAYTVFRGRKHLTKAGKSFKAQVTKAVAGCTTDWRTAHALVLEEGHNLRLTIHLGLPDLQNKTYGVPGGAQHRLRKVDSSNYIKLLEDAISAGSGLDDRYHTEVSITKVHADEPYIHIFLEVIHG